MHTQRFKHRLAHYWLSYADDDSVAYHYGGTRLLSPRASDIEALGVLAELTVNESALKNRLIDIVLADPIPGVQLPNELLGSRVGGGRCVIRPNDAAAHSILSNPRHPLFEDAARELFSSIGQQLNALGGILKITPDFGRFAHLADILAEFTDHSLGVRCESGGCGGKSSYTTTGVYECMMLSEADLSVVTVIGAAGSMGADLVERLRRHGGRIDVCDLTFRDDDPRCLPSEPGKFTDACLRRGGTIVATTVGRELENSRWTVMPAGTHLFLAHNHSLPAGPPGEDLVSGMAASGIDVVQGQLLTFGGALTSRLEHYWRKHQDGRPFDKLLAHELVSQATRRAWSLIEDVMLKHKLHRTAAMHALVRQK